LDFITLTPQELSSNVILRSYYSYYKSLQTVYEHRTFPKRTTDLGAVSSAE